MLLHRAVKGLFCCWYAGDSLRTVLAWLVCWKPVKPSCVGLLFMSPWLCISLQWTLILEESCPARGWQRCWELMSKLAYGWVERCSDVAGCGWILHQKISAAVTSSLQFIYCIMWNDEFRWMLECLRMFASVVWIRNYASVYACIFMHLCYASC